jgi:hypothetical protein
LRAEVLDDAGNVLPGYERAYSSIVTTDTLDGTITWSGHDRLPSWTRDNVKSIRLRFILRNASLYSFHAGDGARVNPD